MDASALVSDRGPTPSQKRKIAVRSPYISGTNDNNDDNDNNNNEATQSQHSGRVPVSRLVMRGAFESPIATRHDDTTQPTTPLSDEELASGAYYSVLRQRVLKYARLQQAEERVAEAVRLVPALVRLFPLESDINLVRNFVLPLANAALEEAVNAPFRTALLWQRALCLSFPTFVRDFEDADTLPAFFGDESTPGAEHGERAHAWRRYYYLVYELFDSLRKNLVIATQRVPDGDWHEFYDAQHEVTLSLLPDVPEETLLITPEHMGVVGDVYDIAVSTFAPTPHGGRTHFDILRWYSTFAPGEFDLPKNAEARALLETRRLWSPRDHLRNFVVNHKAQFVRARAVLQVATAQWWSEHLLLDGTMSERMTPQSVENRKQALERRIATTRRESERFRRSLRALTAENVANMRLARTRTFTSLPMPNNNNNDDDDDDDDGEYSQAIEQLDALAVHGEDAEAAAGDLLINRQLIEFQEQQIQALNARSQEDESELSHLGSILDKQRQATLEVVSYEIASVSEPVLGAPLRAQNFAVLSSPLATEMTTQGREKRARVDIASPRAIIFSESEEDDEDVVQDVLAARAYRPRNLDRRATFQTKYRVNLNCLLRYLVGWTPRGALEFEFKFAYECLLNGALLPPTVAHFIIWLAFSREQTKRSTVLSFHLAQSLDTGDDGVSPDEAARTTVNQEFSTMRELIDKRTYPHLVNYARGL